MITVGSQQTGTPPKQGVYVVRYKFRLNEHIVWYDGGSFSVPYASAHEASTINSVGVRLPRGHKSWWPVAYWREYTDDGQGVVDAMRRAGGG